jgi:hypothetical protein
MRRRRRNCRRPNPRQVEWSLPLVAMICVSAFAIGYLPYTYYEQATKT